MEPASRSASHATLLRALAVLVLVTMLAGVLYAAWISLINFSRISV